ncbi:MAG: hypothetical protein SF097_20235 [Acidobacteriota bacterium]|nr:hypothetical protein [Acidobacteriota bacterium]
MDQNEIYLDAVLGAFKRKALVYLAATHDSNGHLLPSDKRQRVNLVKNALKALSFETYTIAAPNPEDPNNYGCPEGTFCRGGVCVDIELGFDWSDDLGPIS